MYYVLHVRICADDCTLRELVQQNITIVSTRGNTSIVQVPAAHGGDTSVYVIPAILRKCLVGDFLLNFKETINFVHKKTQVVCGVSGKALKPFYIPKTPKRAHDNYYTAMFSVVNRGIIIGYAEEHHEITIREIGVQQYTRKTGEVRIEQIVLYRGHIANIPSKYARYLVAAQAAKQKYVRRDTRTVAYSSI